MNSHDPWEGLLDPDETILWQGRPSPRVRLEWDSPMDMVMAVFFVGFSVFWMGMAAKAGGFIWTFGLLFFGIGLYKLIGIHFWRAHMRKHTHYTLTNKNAFIAINTMGRKSLNQYALTPQNAVTLDEGALSDIWFASEQVQNKQGSHTKRIGFEQLEDGRAVFAKIRQAQGTAL